MSQQDGTNSTGTVSSKWQEFLQGAREIGVFPVNMFKIVSSALSLPGSNAFTEKVFSFMNAKRRADRNRASQALIKAELQVSVNYNITCPMFHQLIVQGDRLLACAASSDKYLWNKHHVTLCTAEPK
jgi:hypothetical protein